MIGKTLAANLLAVSVAGTAAACASPGQRPAREEPAVAEPPSETLSPLFEKALPNVEGMTLTSAIVSFPPRARALPHRHGEAFVYAYVLEGTVRSKLGGEPMRTYHQGDNWSEEPRAHHVLTENTSETDRAKLLVVFVAPTGAELKVDDPKEAAV